MTGSGKLWAKDADPFRATEDAAETDGYAPWSQSREGWARELEIIPTASSDDPTWFIPYLQTITVRHDRRSDQIGLICHSSDMLIMIEGRGLAPLARLISQKRVNVIRVYDAATDGPLAPDAPMISAVTVTGPTGTEA